MAPSEIASAISHASSWSDVFTTLGYTGRPGGNSLERIRRIANDLELDTTRLNNSPGPRTGWSDDDLRLAVKSESTWKAVAERLPTNHATARKHAARLSLDTSHLDAASHMNPHAADPEVLPDWHRLRQAAESMAVSWYALRGFDVFVPASGMETQADLIAVGTDGVLRVQVKTSTRRSGSGWDVNFSRGHRSSLGRRVYTSEEVDEFFVATQDGSFFRIPHAAIPTQGNTVIGRKYSAFRVAMFGSDTTPSEHR